jgi:DNA-binding NarL/FixJ family response regulator
MTNVLIIEDDTYTSVLLEKTIRSAFPSVEVIEKCAYPEEGIRLTKVNWYDLILLSSKRLNYALRLLHTVHYLQPETKILIIGRGNKIEDVTAYLEAGANGVIQRDEISVSKLIDLIEKVFINCCLI